MESATYKGAHHPKKAHHPTPIRFFGEENNTRFDVHLLVSPMGMACLWIGEGSLYPTLEKRNIF